MRASLVHSARKLFNSTGKTDRTNEIITQFGSRKDVGETAVSKPGADLAAVSLLALAASLLHGYHLGTDDGAIYIPAIKKVADPELYPFNSQFFSHHASLSIFPDILGHASSLLTLSTNLVTFLTYISSIFLLLLGARQLASVCFKDEPARWAGVSLLAGVLSVPVCGTALILVDPYVTARSLSTPFTLLAIASLVGRKRVAAVAWLALTALVHPQMGAYGAAFAVVFECAAHLRARVRQAIPVPALAAALMLPLSFELQPAEGPYREVLQSRSYFLVTHWEWWEWMGVILPLIILWQLPRLKRFRTYPVFLIVCRSLVCFGGVFTVAAIVLASSDRFDYWARLQPMRSFHLIYLVFFIFLGAFLGEYLLKRKVWRWAALFVPLTAGMWTLEAANFPTSSHIEWPGVPYKNGWLSAFDWIARNTPKDAYFALDPNYTDIPGVDLHGFRAIAERSVLADNLKDSGAASVFPELANVWKEQVSAQKHWKSFHIADFRRLYDRYGVGYFVLANRQLSPGLDCLYKNDQVMVCRLTQSILSSRRCPTPKLMSE